MLKKKLFYLFLLIIIVFSSFVVGIFFENKKFFPYFTIKSIYNKIKYNESDKKIKIEKKIDIKEFKNIKLTNISENEIETSILRLNKKTINLKSFFKRSETYKSRGGICNYKDKVLIVSAAGEATLIDLNNNELIFVDLYNHFKKENILIDLVQDIICLDNPGEELSFLINIHIKEKDKFINQNYEAEYTSNVYKIKFEDNSTINKIRLFKSKKHGINWAGRMAKNDNFLYMSFSTKESNKETKYPIPLSQDDEVLEGKIIEINLRNGSYRTYSKGHRNPQGLTILSNNKILSTEHGPRGGDELNYIQYNKNYGWPLVTHGTTYTNFEAYNYIETIPGRHDGYQKPIFSWTPGIGISNLIEIKNFHKTWNGDLLISSLKNMSLYRLRVIDDKVMFSERIWIGKRIRDISSNEKGDIFLWTDDKNFIQISRVISENSVRSVKTYDITLIGACLSCHYLNSGERPSTNLIAPTLSKIFERNIASDDFYNYSQSLKKLDGKWNEKNMISYLMNPQKFAPGTYKSYKVLNKSKAIKIVGEIKKLSQSGD